MQEGNMEEVMHSLKRIASPGLTSEQLMETYKTMQEGKFRFDQLTEERIYQAALVTASTLADQVPKGSRENMAVLDIGAGTGRVGEAMQQHGFKTVDAVEPCRELLQTAIQKNVYRKVYQFLVTGEETPLPADSYDAILTCGTFMENHLPIEALYAFLRLVKTGGFIVITTRERYLQSVAALKDRLEPLMKSLEEQGRWKMLSRRVFPKYHCEDDGVVWTFLVL